VEVTVGERSDRGRVAPGHFARPNVMHTVGHEMWGVRAAGGHRGNAQARHRSWHNRRWTGIADPAKLLTLLLAER